MKTKASWFALGMLALGVSTGPLVAGCGQTDSPVGAVFPIVGAPCSPPGTRAPAGDGCNECTCQNGAWSCTEQACTGECSPGASMQATDGCNTCICTDDGDWACTRIACGDCSPGATMPAGDGCNTCTCTADGSWACTEEGCNICQEGAVTMPDCNECRCVNGNWQCTMRFCGNCEVGYAHCDGDPNNACETNIMSSPNNCGACNVICALPNATSVCQTGACAIQACNAGFADCNADTVDGCEASIGDSVDNCGSCGNLCSTNNGISACNEGICVLSECSEGFANCDGVAENGCEVDTDVDILNCGNCGLACPSVGPAPVCTSGICG